MFAHREMLETPAYKGHSAHPGDTMTISQRERRVLDAIEGELTRDATLARLARLFTGPVPTPPDVWVGARRPIADHATRKQPPNWLFVVLTLIVTLSTAGMVLGVMFTS
jgi:hypothetical protein